MTPNRRSFIKKAAISAIAAAFIPEVISAAYKTEKIKKISLKKDSIILFQGDSITDSGRNKTEKMGNNNSALGNGYPFITASELLFQHPEKNLTIYNKGISGNKVYQLAERWDTDCLEIKPDILSILVGVNDFWHKHNKKYDGTVKIYSEDFKRLLERTVQKLPDVKLIIGEPFAVSKIKAVDQTWFPEFYEYQKAAREIATSFGAVLIPYQSIFDKAQKLAPGAYWTGDGVHPTIAGARLMSEAWLEVIK